MNRFLLLCFSVGLVLVGCAREDIDIIATPEDSAVATVEESSEDEAEEIVEPTDAPQADVEEESSGSMVEETGSETPGGADADVTFVSATQTGEEEWLFSVTVAHPDTGWEDYADGWDVVLPDGTVAKPDPDSPFTRLLLHPHENEQPFTRSQSGIRIPSGVNTVTVRAHDIVDGFGGQEVAVDLTAASGPNFEVIKN